MHHSAAIEQNRDVEQPLLPNSKIFWFEIFPSIPPPAHCSIDLELSKNQLTARD